MSYNDTGHFAEAGGGVVITDSVSLPDISLFRFSLSSLFSLGMLCVFRNVSIFI